MKKKLLSLAVCALMGTAASAQVNVQFHYDLGRQFYPQSQNDRQHFTATIEQFRPDRLGNIFYFIDLDFYAKGMKGAYLEFSREFNVSAKGLAAHIEYNGGLTTGHHCEYASQFQHVFLLGPSYNHASADFRRTWSVQALFRQTFGGQFDASAYPGWQVTGVWGINFARDDMFTFSGYIDLWRGHKGGGDYQVVAMTEPQLWYNFDSMRGARKTHLSIGTEWEMSHNFIYPTAGHKRFYLNPTIALKWTMKGDASK